MDWSILPAINAGFNGLSAVLLTLGYRFIKHGHRQAHIRCMVGALISSTLFLAGYLTYHSQVHAVTRFVDPAWFRPIYLAILISHTLLAVIILPLVIITVTWAAKGRFEKHRRIARWTWPIWMYVSVTGVIVYLILYQIFPQR